MKRRTKIATFILLLPFAVIISPLGFLGAIYFFGGDMCGNYVHDEINSPSGKHKAVIFQRDCGATTGFSTQISIIPANEQLENSSGNIYIIDGHPDKVAPRLSWRSENEVVVRRPLNGSEYKAKTSLGWFNKVRIEYGESGS